MTRPRRNRGVALIAVLFVAAMLTILLYAFLREMQVEASLANSFGREKQAEQLGWSAIEKGAAAFVADTETHSLPTSTWYTSAAEFYEIECGDGVFTLFRAPDVSDGSEPPHWGAMSESCRLNLNYAPKEVLMKLPNMTEEIADAIIDWIDEDDTVNALGAENAYYQALTPGYACKNGLFDTVEELLLVKGVTPELLYGEDANQNGLLDANENDGTEAPPTDNNDGTLDRGWIPYLTVWSYDKNLRADGTTKRININTATPQTLQTELGDVLNQQDIQNMQIRRLQFNPPGVFQSVAHLMDVPNVQPGGISKDKWKRIVDRITIVDMETLPGVIDVNLAPKEVLKLLPNLTDEEITAIINYRTLPDADLSNIGWLADALPTPKLQGIANYVTTRTWQVRLDAVGRVGPKSTLDETAKLTTVDTSIIPPARVTKRYQAVFDKAAETPRFVWWKDMSRMGMPYSISEP